jgi:integrase
MATIEKYQLSSGATQYRVRYRTPDGRSTQKRGFTTKRAAEVFANKVEVDKSTGAYVAPSLGRVTVGTLGPLWLERRRGHMKPSGYRSYESAWRVHVEPAWGNRRIAGIKHTEVQAWVSALATRRGPVIVRAAHLALSQILADAVRDGLLPSNPARGVKLPPKTPQRHIYLSADQLDKLATEAGPYRSLVLLLGTAGLRWGEAVALTVGDVDFLRRRIALHRNAVKVGGTFQVGTLKGGKSRTVAVPRFVIDALAKTVKAKGRDDLLWPSTSGGYLRPPSSTESWLAGAVARCQSAADEARADERKSGQGPTTPAFPRVTAHDLRHTAASLAISAGANVKVIQRMLGHASAAMTLDVYADLFDSDLDTVAESVAKMWPRDAKSV